ncbi:MAG: hypothetical protein IJ634_04825 [Bacteroidales bacterium]|nr:hypothetical protein [Bacteroidales bacterium]
MKRILLPLLLLLSIATRAQNSEYFPEGYFNNGSCDYEAGLVVDYMRLAGIEPLWDSTTAKGTVLLRLFETLHFDSLPRAFVVPKLDGAQWVVERRTVDTFNAFLTNVAGSNLANLYDYLIKLARIKATYARDYVH